MDTRLVKLKGLINNVIGKHRNSFNARVVDRRVFYRPSLSITCDLVY